MTTSEKRAYYDATFDKKTRDDLKKAITLVGLPKVAIDCGCGAGSDIAFLLSEGFVVHGFDIENASIVRCQKRFEGDARVHLSQASFNTFKYPNASLIVADASLFFCPEGDFDEVWCKITKSIVANGVFCGSFLGPEDTMASPNFDKKAYWPEVLVLTVEKILEYFVGFNLVSFTEHKTSGIAPGGKPHRWHIFSVVAVKE